MTWILIFVVAAQMYTLEESFGTIEGCKTHGELVAKEYPHITSWECAPLIKPEGQQ